MAPFPLVDVPGSPTPATDGTPTLTARQSEETLTCNSGVNLNAGEVAGIVIGSIAGTLLLLWLIRSCLNLGAPPAGDREKVFRHVEPEHRRRHRSKRRSHSHRRSRSADMDVPPAAYYKESSGRGRRYYV